MRISWAHSFPLSSINASSLMWLLEKPTQQTSGGIHESITEGIKFVRVALPVSASWPLVKMVCYYLDPGNPTKSCKLRGSNLHVHFKDITQTTKYLKDVILKKQCGVTMIGVPGPNRVSGHKGVHSGPKKVLNFCYTCLKMQRAMPNLRI